MRVATHCSCLRPLCCPVSHPRRSDRGLITALLAALLATTLPLARGVDVTGRCVAGPTTGTCANLAPFGAPIFPRGRLLARPLDSSELCLAVWENATYTSANANATVNLFVANRAFLPQPCIDAGLPFLCAEVRPPALHTVMPRYSAHRLPRCARPPYPSLISFID